IALCTNGPEPLRSEALSGHFGRRSRIRRGRPSEPDVRRSGSEASAKELVAPKESRKGLDPSRKVGRFKTACKKTPLSRSSPTRSPARRSTDSAVENYPIQLSRARKEKVMRNSCRRCICISAAFVLLGSYSSRGFAADHAT